MPYTQRDPSTRAPPLPQNACATHSSGQTYQELKLECQQKETLFEDCDFPASDSSLFYSEKPPVSFVWKRPGVSLNQECIFYELKFVQKQKKCLSLRVIVKHVIYHTFQKKWLVFLFFFIWSFIKKFKGKIKQNKNLAKA